MNKTTKKFEELIKQQGGKFIICCSDSPNNKCEEDLNGCCYYCKRNMLDDKE